MTISRLTNWFGGKYDDDRLLAIVRHAIDADPLIAEPATLTVTVKKGVITIDGVVHRAAEKDRIEGVVRNALRTIGIKFDRVVNDLRMVNQPQPR
ncbi:MAG: hypothetical protein DCC57_20520 [Chloroflexi bacterium]|nr:MAG: hypothetical protein DCC57_20520 [Chloroflexota bacterium]